MGIKDLQLCNHQELQAIDEADFQTGSIPPTVIPSAAGETLKQTQFILHTAKILKVTSHEHSEVVDSEYEWT